MEQKQVTSRGPLFIVQPCGHIDWWRPQVPGISITNFVCMTHLQIIFQQDRELMQLLHVFIKFLVTPLLKQYISSGKVFNAIRIINSMVSSAIWD